MENSNSTTKFVGALLLGAAVGATIGILFAPDKGSETRRKISSKGSDLADSVKDNFNKLVNDAKKDVEVGRSKMAEGPENRVARDEKLKVN